MNKGDMSRNETPMKKLMLALIVAMVAAAASADATPIIIRSTGASAAETHSGVNGVTPGTTVPLTATHGLWYSPAGRTWVSFVDDYSPTPDGQSGCDGSEICNNDYVDFFHDFTLPTGLFTGVLNVLADDTADVWVNGTKVFNRAPETDPYSTCAASAIGCLSGTEATIDIGSYLKTDGSLNTFRFTVFQENGTGFGLNYQAEMNAAPPDSMMLLLDTSLVEPAAVPEPGSTMLLLGTSLVGLVAAARRRLRK
jgi:hypothetical protein